MIVIIGILVFLYIGYTKKRRVSSERVPIREDSSALEIALLRYAKGDISLDEYIRLKNELGY